MRSIRDLTAIGVRRLQAAAFSAAGITDRKIARRAGSAVVLVYHRVVGDREDVSGIEPGMFVRESTFERHLLWIKERCEVATLGKLLEAGFPDPDRPAAALTFDDGWKDNLDRAWPVLQRHGLRATVFLVSRWCESQRNRFLSPADVADLARSGMEFGAHTETHPDLRDLDADRIRAEMSGSKLAVESWTGAPCRLFAYPYGCYDEKSVRVARQLFDGSVTVGMQWWSNGTDTALIPRVSIHEDMSRTRSQFLARLAGIL